MLGIFIGIAAVVALISLGQGMQKAVNEQFDKIGKNRITVNAGGAYFGPMGSELSVEKLSDEDIKVVKNTRGIKSAQGMATETARVDYRDETEHIQVFGIPTDSQSINEIKDMGFFEIGSGRELRSSGRYEAIIAYNIANDLFSREIKARDRIKIEGVDFSVVGVQAQIGTGVHDAIIRIPLDTMKEIFSIGNEYSMIVATVKEGEDVDATKERVESALRKSRDVEENEEDFIVQTSAQMIEQLNMILDVVQAVLIGIAAISLVVGGIGIMNTMYTSVLERTKEIGIMKAVGARNSQIMWLFLIEAGMLGLVGGGIGVAMGLGLSKAAELVAVSMGVTALQAAMSPQLIIIGLSFSFIVGAISGTMPAREAAAMQPVEAMRK